jgi:DNA-binding FadR family transcriptional regulator
LAKPRQTAGEARAITAQPREPSTVRPSLGRNVIRIPKTAEVVAAHIRKMIIRGEVREGDFLQSEAQLMEHFGTSRPTIREAFRILENEQLISVTRGSRSGARVHAPSVDSVARYAGFALQVQDTLLSDIYLATLGLEPFTARLVAERHTPEQLAALNAELDGLFALAETGPDAALRIALVRLHQSIVEAAGSNTLSMISAMLHGVAEQHMSKFVSHTPPPEKEVALRRTRAGLRSFRKLLQLIEARDADGAEAHWREHMQNANATWLFGYDQTALVDVLD